MKKPTDMGKNETGVGTAPVQSRKTARGAREGGASLDGDFPAAHTRFYEQYQEELEPVGTMPPPSGLKGVATAVAEKMKGHRGTVLLDKMGERLAFERTGTRLYDGVLAKVELAGSWVGGPTLDDLAEIRDQEAEHFALLVDAMRSLGADPTALTPGGDVAAVESLGIHNVIADPRTTVAQCLHALLVVELTDNAGWEMLAELANDLGHSELGAQFGAALVTEDQHLERIKTWLRAQRRSEAGVSVAASPAK